MSKEKLTLKKDNVKPIEKRVVFNENDLDLAEDIIPVLHLFVPEQTTIEDLQKPSAWANIAYRMRPMTRVFVTEKTGKWIAEVWVVSCSQLAVQCQVLSHTEIAAHAKLDKGDGLEVKWVNYKEKYGVLRTTDNVWVSKGHDTAAQANLALANEMKAFRQA